jgi:hypothetical protein
MAAPYQSGYSVDRTVRRLLRRSSILIAVWASGRIGLDQGGSQAPPADTAHAARSASQLRSTPANVPTPTPVLPRT